MHCWTLKKNAAHGWSMTAFLQAGSDGLLRKRVS